MGIKSLSVRIDSEILDRLHMLAAYEGRSANSQIIILIRKAIIEFEREQDAQQNSKGQYAKSSCREGS